VAGPLAAPRLETQGAVPVMRHEVSEVGTYWSRLHQPYGREGSESRAPRGELERQGDIDRSWCPRIATPSLPVSDSANCAGLERTLYSRTMMRGKAKGLSARWLAQSVNTIEAPWCLSAYK